MNAKKNSIRSASLLLALCANIAGCSTSVCRPANEADLEALAREEEVSCDVLIWNTSLQTLDSLRGLRRVLLGVSVEGNNDLHDVSGLSGLERVGFLTLGRNKNLSTVAMELDAEVYGLQILHASLERLDLRLQPSMEELAIYDVDRLEVLALRGLAAVKGLRIQELDQLASLDGLSDLRSAGSVKLRDLPLVTRAQADAFLAQLDAPPEEAVICGLADTEPCP